MAKWHNHIRPFWEKYALLILILFGTLIRIYQVFKYPLWVDEVVSVAQSMHSLEYFFDVIALDVHFPLFGLLLYGSIKLFGIGEFSVRFVSLICGVLLIPVVYFLGQKIKSVKTGRVAALLVTISPLLIYYSAEARYFSLFTLLATISYYFFLSTNRKKSLFGLIIANTLLLYTNIFAIFIFLAQVLYALFFKKKLLKNYIISSIMTLILFLPWLPTALNQITNTKVISWIPIPTLDSLIYFFNMYFGNYILFIFLLIFLYRQKSFRLNSLLLLWILLPIILVLVYSYFMTPIFYFRYFIFILPAIFILFAKTFEHFSDWVFVAIVLAMMLTPIPVIKDEWPLVVQNIQTPLIIEPDYQMLPFLYYYNQSCFGERNRYECAKNSNIFALNRGNSLIFNQQIYGIKLNSTLIETIYVLQLPEQNFNATLEANNFSRTCHKQFETRITLDCFEKT